MLQQQADALKQQGDELQAQADELQAQKQQLIALQAKAKKQQKQATKLHNELVKTLTKAGGDDRGTDPRLVKLQDALTNDQGRQAGRAAADQQEGQRRGLHRDRDHRARPHRQRPTW